MKLVIQRVNSASVAVVAGEVVGKIGKGLFVLLGVKKGDTTKNADFLVDKLLKLRIMADENDKMNLSVMDTQSEILIVSQFTLYANTKEGNRPSFIEAATPKEAKEIYNYFIEEMKASGLQIATGKFGEYMHINASLDGPVTIILES